MHTDSTAFPTEIPRAIKACMRKVAFATRKLAKDAAAKALRRENVQLDVYRCTNCHMWHTTSWVKVK